jgi:hypothetical protein
MEDGLRRRGTKGERERKGGSSMGQRKKEERVVRGSKRGEGTEGLRGVGWGGGGSERILFAENSTKIKARVYFNADVLVIVPSH